MTLKVHHLRPAPGAHKPKTRVGRGEGSKGKTAGRGTKGTKARYQVPESFEGGQMPFHMRVPKLKGFKNPFRTEYQVVNLDKLAELFPDGGEVTPEVLVERGAVRKGELVKILGTGDVAHGAHGVRARVLEHRAREDHGSGRHRDRPVVAPARSTARWAGRRGTLGGHWMWSPDPIDLGRRTGSVRTRRSRAYRLRQGLPDSGPAEQDAVHAGDPGGVPLRVDRARAWRELPATFTPASRWTRTTRSWRSSTCSAAARCSS